MPSADFSREILKDTVFKFAPETQKLRSEAMDVIVENSLYKIGGWVQEGEMTDLLSGKGGITPSPKQVISSLESLENKDRIDRKKEGGVEYFRLREKRKKDIDSEKEGYDRTSREVISNLSQHKDVDTSTYKKPFENVLSYIFAELGEESISVLDNERKDTSINTNKILEYCEKSTEGTQAKSNVLKKIIIDFFDKNDPRYNRIKWQYAQSFFIAKSIGVDYGGPSLSSEAFEDAVFYIDTNVAIPAIEPADRLHSSFHLIQRMTSQLNAGFEISTRTLDELDDWANDQFDKVSKAIGTVPTGVFSDANTLFSKIYDRKKEKGEYDGPTSLFEKINSAEEVLKAKGVSIQHNGWFVDEHKNDRRTEQIVERVRSASQRVRNKDKNPNFQASHDAILFSWVIHQRKQGYNAWILTADTSLPAVNIPNHEGTSLVVTLDALLQWLSPVIRTDKDLEDFQQVFSELIRSRILPQKTIFGIDEMNVFAELGMNVKDLPKEDVEKCLDVIDKKTPDLNLSKPEDREELNHEIRKIISSPDREYKSIIRRKNKNISEKDNEIKRLEKEVSDKDKKISDLKNDLSSLHDRVGSMEDQMREEQIESEGRRRLIGLAVLILLEASLPFILSHQFGGDKAMTVGNILKYSPVFFGLAAVTVPTFGFFVSNEHLQALGLYPKSED
jgi:hypothetical protein